MSREIKIVKGHSGEDHVRLLVSCPPKLSPAKVMQYLKGRSSRTLQDEFSHLKKRYWGRHLWARGYFRATVGVVTEEQIRDISRDMRPSLQKRTFTLAEARS